MNPRFAALVFAIVLAASCASAAPPGNLPDCVRHAAFSGITPTDATGHLLGEPDPADWGCLGGGALLSLPVPPPTSTCLEPAYPNPASESTSLRFALPREADVSLIVYVQHGKRGRAFPVRTLVSRSLPAGVHMAVWDLRDDQGVRLAPDVYRAVIVVKGAEVWGDIEVR